MPVLWTLDQILKQLEKPMTDYPGLAWPSRNLTFSFSEVVSPDSVGKPESETFSPFSIAQRVAARSAMDAFADVIDMHFTEVSGLQGNAGDIRFANYLGPTDSAFSNGLGSGSGGDIFVSITSGGSSDHLNPFVGGGDYKTLLHELGHSLGLSHPGNYNGGSPTWAKDASFKQDTVQFTVMSYFGPSDYPDGGSFLHLGVDHFPQTLMLYDIAALQQIYGANLSTRTGATTYGFHSTIALDSPYNFTNNPYPVVCIDDAGGRDRIDFSGFSGPTRINLAQGSFSSTQDLAQNVSIAFGTVIEEALGGSGADQILGNSTANVLRGGGGNDTLWGYAGNDRLSGGNGSDRLVGGAGSDTLTGGLSPDVFVLNEAPTGGSGIDTVVDFIHTRDEFQLLRSAFADMGRWSGARFHASTTGRAHDASDRILYETDTGKLFYDADGNTALGVARIQIAVLQNLAHLDWTDFAMI